MKGKAMETEIGEIEAIVIAQCDAIDLACQDWGRRVNMVGIVEYHDIDPAETR